MLTCTLTTNTTVKGQFSDAIQSTSEKLGESSLVNPEVNEIERDERPARDGAGRRAQSRAGACGQAPMDGLGAPASGQAARPAV
jgi:hypothetical protein